MSASVTVVTGGGGFLGEHLARSFADAGSAVRLFDWAPPPPWFPADGMEYIRGDVRDEAAVDRALEGATAVVHAAFASPRQTARVIRSVNSAGTTNICLSARRRGVSRLVLVSSILAAAAPRPHPFLTASPLARLDLYRQSRTDAERIVTEARTPGLRVAIVRPQSFLGPGRLGAFGIIFEMVRAGEPIPVLGSGTHRYQLVGVRDLADGIRLLAHGPGEGVFAFGAKQFGTVREDFETLLAHAHSTAGLRMVPGPLARAAIRALELAGAVPLSEWHRHGAWGHDCVADTSRAEHELGWHPTRSNADALIEAYDWYADTIRASGDAPRTHPVPRAHRLFRPFIRLLPRA